MFEEITAQASAALTELLETAHPAPGSLCVIGCSSSEIIGNPIGNGSSLPAAQAVFDGIYPILQTHGLALAAQCCEHLNRALIVERETARRFGYPIVNAVPWEHGGGSFATTAYQRFRDPVAVERVQAQVGLDIGLTLIGMHMEPVAVPVRLSIKQIGQAPIVCARTRPKFIGGERARYDEKLK